MRASTTLLRRADPARDLGPQPDARAASDLQRILAGEPAGAAAPLDPYPYPHPRRVAVRSAVVAVTVLAVVVTASIAAVNLGRGAQPATIGTPIPTGTLGPSPQLGGCDPSAILPFECGTYRSDYGAKSVTGDHGGPAQDPLTLSFSSTAGGLVLTATSAQCISAQLPVTIEGSRLVVPASARIGQGRCFGSGPDTAEWAYAFLRGPLEFQTGTGFLTFNERTAMVSFEYEGVPVGGKTIPRNDARCVPAHVAPFPCGTFRSTSGTGRLAFLGQDPYRLSFQHVNGELSVALYGRCGVYGASFEPDGPRVVSTGGNTGMAACFAPWLGPGDPLQRFLNGVLAYRVDGRTVTLSSGTSSATFAASR